MTAEASRADEIVARARGPGSARPIATRRVAGGRGPTASGCCAGSGARCWGRSPRRCRATRRTGRSRAAVGGHAGGGGAPPGAGGRGGSPAGRRPGAADARGRGREARRVSRPLAARARDADPCLFRARRGRVAADARLGAADRRGLSFSRKEVLMATLVLAAAGSALGGAVGGSSRARRHGAGQGGGRHSRVRRSTSGCSAPARRRWRAGASSASA